MEKVTLYYVEKPDIKISMEIYFNEKDQLYFEGYDIGNLVKEAFGDSDYEYDYTVEPFEVEKLYVLFGLESGNKSGLLQEIKKRFCGNDAYSLFGNFMKKNNVDFESSDY